MHGLSEPGSRGLPEELQSPVWRQPIHQPSTAPTATKKNIVLEAMDPAAGAWAAQTSERVFRLTSWMFAQAQAGARTQLARRRRTHAANAKATY